MKLATSAAEITADHAGNGDNAGNAAFSSPAAGRAAFPGDVRKESRGRTEGRVEDCSESSIKGRIEGCIVEFLGTGVAWTILSLV
jgi:hypothetical protein